MFRLTVQGTKWQNDAVSIFTANIKIGSLMILTNGGIPDYQKNNFLAGTDSIISWMLLVSW